MEPVGQKAVPLDFKDPLTARIICLDGISRSKNRLTACDDAICSSSVILTFPAGSTKGARLYPTMTDGRRTRSFISVSIRRKRGGQSRPGNGILPERRTSAVSLSILTASLWTIVRVLALRSSDI